MTGHTLGSKPRARTAPSPAPRSASSLIYEGIDAVRKIREVLGPTDPAKAPPGSIRREFGSTIMVNAAHASDSADNARREMGIVKIRENNFKSLIESFYQGLSAQDYALYSRKTLAHFRQSCLNYLSPVSPKNTIYGTLHTRPRTHPVPHTFHR